MPVVTAEELLRDGSRPESLSASRYASVTALCAATHIQLKLDGAERMTDMQNHNVTEMMCQYTEGFMLSCAVQARQEYDIIEDAGTDSLLSSFFLFAAYGNLDKHMHAWFYLSQSLAQCIALDLHDESTYLTLEPGDAELKRRIFWILFVTERTYALQHAKPAILRSSIRKPDIFSSNCPSIIYGLLNHISLFEMLPNDLYTWGFTSSSSLYTQASLAASVCHALCEAKSSKSMVASQHLDTLVTQEWLKTEMWKLSLGWRPNSLSSGGPLLSFLLPFSAGKFTMEALTSVDASSRDACGIAMEQKLFDIGTCVVDTALAVSNSSTKLCDGLVLGPMDLLDALLKSLANIRGAQSHLFTVLLKKSDPILGISSPKLLIEATRSYESFILPATMQSPILELEGAHNDDIDDGNCCSVLAAT
ncbi:hypothetical protein IFR04_007864 [Cadophora malorum]|uniref:Xylanolytic transcriptional activator regulatory domain-containing protein n=1 Tax=Cadophora malorum TaxID=108018 RepID=A0A8H7THP3_9HELO|nr:hypothetical protein IFR04_007864 [Cadophora malorum]